MSAAAIWLLLQAEFLAIVLVLVYVGAVMVLFLFVVMMLDINVDQVRHGFWQTPPVALFVGAAIVIELSLVIWMQFGPVKRPMHRRCRRTTATPRRWAGCSIPTTSTRCRSPA